MSRICAPLLAFTFALVFSTPILADEFKHEARVMGKMGNHPNQIQFIGPTTLDVTFPTSGGLANNPLYEDLGMSGENPFYDSSAPPGTPDGVESISFILDNTNLQPIATGEGVIHRDIAARNIIVQTNGGTFESAPSEFLLFGNDGPPDLRDPATHVGPIRWMAPESLRLYSPGNEGSTNPEHYFDILGGLSFFTTSYVPEPATVSLYGLALTLIMRRHKR